MTIGYLIQSFNDHETLKYLVKLLLEDKTSQVFIHIDKKSDILLFYIDEERVHFIEKREFVSWAGYSQTRLVFNLIEYALNFPTKCDYYCFISESCYPVFAGEKLKGKICEAKNIILSATVNEKDKIEKYWFFDFHVKSPFINKVLHHSINCFTGMLYKFNLFKKEPYTYIDGKKAEIFASSTHFRLSYDEIKYVYDVYENNDELRKYLQYSFASQELVVATIIGNSEYRDDCVIQDKYTSYADLCSLHYLRYDGPRVNVLHEEDYENIVKSGKPFIRKIKVDDPSSARLIEKLEKRKVR